MLAPVNGRRMLLVDDTFTTGAAVQSASSALTKAGDDRGGSSSYWGGGDRRELQCVRRVRAEEARRRAGQILGPPGLQLNPDKTRIVCLTEGMEGFDFLGFHCHKVQSWRWRGRWYLQHWPSRAAMAAVTTAFKGDVDISQGTVDRLNKASDNCHVFDTALVEALRVVVSSVLLLAGASKLAAPDNTRDAFVDLLRFPERASRFAVFILAFGELGTALLVCTSLSPVLGYSALLVMGVGVTLVSSIAVLSGKRIPCGCFGPGSQHLSLRNTLTGLVLTGVAGILLVVPPDVTVSGTGSDPMRLLAVGILAMLVALGQHADQVLGALRNWNLKSN